MSDFLQYCKITNKKIIFSVGNISENKNQKQLIEILHQCQEDNVVAIIFGREADNGFVRGKILDYHLEEKVILVGYCDHIQEYWQYADINILFSVNDGFGLSIIEGYVNGVPSLAFADLDATVDVYSPETMVKIPSREALIIIDMMKTALNKNWNKPQIERFGRKFSIEAMTDKYLHMYKKIIEN